MAGSSVHGSNGHAGRADINTDGAPRTGPQASVGATRDEQNSDTMAATNPLFGAAGAGATQNGALHTPAALSALARNSGNQASRASKPSPPSSLRSSSLSPSSSDRTATKPDLAKLEPDQARRHSRCKQDGLVVGIVAAAVVMIGLSIFVPGGPVLFLGLMLAMSALPALGHGVKGVGLGPYLCKRSDDKAEKEAVHNKDVVKVFADDPPTPQVQAQNDDSAAMAQAQQKIDDEAARIREQERLEIDASASNPDAGT